MVSRFSMKISIFVFEGESIIKRIPFQQKRMVTSQQFNIDTHNSHIWSRRYIFQGPSIILGVDVKCASNCFRKKNHNTRFRPCDVAYVCSNHKKFNQWHWVYVHYFHSFFLNPTWTFMKYHELWRVVSLKLALTVRSCKRIRFPFWKVFL